MRRNVMFGKGRGWRPEDMDERYRGLHLEPGRGAEVGEYATDEPGEYSDSYYGPGDRYARRNVASDGYVRGQFGPRSNINPYVGGVVGARGPARGTGYIGYGELHSGDQSWADLGVSSVRGGKGGATGQSFRGRGPKGYVRSDERLKEIVCERLTDHPKIDASDVNVEAKAGEITLTGEVSDRMMKWRIEDLIEDATGGALVHNRLRVRRSEPRRE